MDPLKDEDVIYGTSTIRRYLKKFHGVMISDHELNQKLIEIIEDEIREEGEQDDTATRGACEDIGGYS